MENVLLVILLILALALIAVVLLQRSEGGGLGIGGGGGGGVMSARGAATALGKVTWILGISFLAVSLAMTVVSARNAADSSVIDRVEGTAPAPDAAEPAAPALPGIEDLVPQTDGGANGDAATGAPASTTGEAPLAPPRAD